MLSAHPEHACMCLLCGGPVDDEPDAACLCAACADDKEAFEAWRNEPQPESDNAHP